MEKAHAYSIGIIQLDGQDLHNAKEGDLFILMKDTRVNRALQASVVNEEVPNKIIYTKATVPFTPYQIIEKIQEMVNEDQPEGKIVITGQALGQITEKLITRSENGAKQ